MNDILVKIGADITDFSRKMEESNKQISNFGKANRDMFAAVGKTGDFLTKAITLPAIAAATALTGITLVKGFNRLVGIDTARAKLSALGHDAESVEVIMDNALTSVEGTSYGLDEAATIAASAVAAGIKPGKELAKYLGSTGDAAAVAGTDLSEMGQIFNQVQTAQRAYTYDLNMLANRGLPIYQWIGDAAGKTADQVRDMARNGEISSEMFFDAIDKNIGGAAKIIGEKSFAAAVKNVGSDIARIGAKFLDAGGEGGGFFSKMKPLLTEFRGYLKSLEGSAEEMGVKFGDAFSNMIDTLRNLKSAYDSLSPAIQTVIKYAALLGTFFIVTLGPLLKLIAFIPRIISGFGALKGAIAGIGAALGAVSWPVVLIIAAIAALVAAFVIAYKKSERFREVVNNAFNSVVEVVSSAIGVVSAFVMEMWGFLVDWWEENNELILEATSRVWNGIMDAISTVMEVLIPLIQHYWEMVQIVIEVVWEFIMMAIKNALELITGIISAVMQVINGDWEGAWQTIKETFINIWDNMRDFLSTVLPMIVEGIKTNFTFIKDNITTLLTAAKDKLFELFGLMLGWVIAKAQEMLSNIIDKFTQIRTNIKSKIESAKQSLITAFTNMVSNARTKAAEIVNTVRDKFEEIKSKIREKLTEAVTIVGEKISEMPGKVIQYVGEMLSAGSDLIQGLIEGIKSKAQDAVDAVGNVVGDATAKAKSLLGIASPSKVFMEIGAFTGEGLAKGISKTVGVVRSASERLIGAMLTEGREIDLSYDTPDGIRSTLTSAVNGTVSVSDRDDRLIGALASIERRLGELEVNMDGERVGNIVKPHVNEGNAVDAMVRRYFD